jgi:hypothetical protein
MVTVTGQRITVRLTIGDPVRGLTYSCRTTPWRCRYANGIKFAFPTVQIAGEGEAASAAVAQRGLELLQPAAS